MHDASLVVQEVSPLLPPPPGLSTKNKNKLQEEEENLLCV